MNFRTILLASLLSTVCFVATETVCADSGAKISGALTDPSGAAVSGARVTALPAAGGTAVETKSDANGQYRLELSAGSWRVRITQTSFEPLKREFTLAAGETREWNARLELAKLSSSVVVTADASPAPADSTPAPVSIVTRQQIDARQEISLPDQLAVLPGVSVARSGAEGGIASLFLDGGNSNFTKVLVDGVPVNEPGGAVNFSNYTLDNVDKIEVVHGAESALFGSDAVAGVIQVFSHRGTTRTPQLTLLGEGGNFSTGRGSAQLSGLLGPFDYAADYAFFGTQGQGPNDRFLNRTLSGNFGWRFTDTDSLRLTVRNNTSDAGIPGQTLITPLNLDQTDKLQNFSAGLSADFTTGAHWVNHVAGYESYLHQLFSNPLADFFDPGDPFCTPLAPHAVASQFCDFPFVATNQFNRAGFAGQSAYVFAKGSVTGGYDYEVENGWLSSLEARHVRRNNQAGFLDVRLTPVRRLTLVFGARAEANTSFGTRVAPRVGAAWLVRDARGLWGTTRLFASYGQGIKEPRFDQSFGTDPCDPGNPGLRPEQSRTVHAGADQTLLQDRLKLTADVFYNRFYDIVSFTFCLPGGPCPVTPPPGCGFGFGTFFNTDLARARGTNLSAEVRPARWLHIEAGYSYDDSRVLKAPNAFDPSETPGNRLLRRPVNSGNLALTGVYRGVLVNLAGYFSGPRTDSDFLGLGLLHNPGYAKLDFAASYDVSRNLSFFGRVENLLDKRYQEVIGFPALGRNFSVGTKLRFGGE